MDDHAEIATERLILRPLAPEHAAALYEIHADPEAMRFWHAPPHKHLDETRAMVDELIGGPERVWVLCQRDGKEGIGLVYTWAMSAVQAWATSRILGTGERALWPGRCQ